jgi:hypothetical protein
MNVRVTTGDWSGVYEVESNKDAIKAFFRDIAAGKIKRFQLGLIGDCNDPDGLGEETLFRIAPALCLMDMITAEELLLSFKNAELDFNMAELESMLEQDAWMVAELV